MKLSSQIIYSLILCTLILACAENSSKAKQSSQLENKATHPEEIRDKHSLLSLEITKKYPKRDFNIQEIAEIEYIPLETTDDILLDEEVH